MPWILNHKHKIEEKSTKSSQSSKDVSLGLADLWEFPTLYIICVDKISLKCLFFNIFVLFLAKIHPASDMTPTCWTVVGSDKCKHWMKCRYDGILSMQIIICDQNSITPRSHINMLHLLILILTLLPPQYEPCGLSPSGQQGIIIIWNSDDLVLHHWMALLGHNDI